MTHPGRKDILAFAASFAAVAALDARRAGATSADGIVGAWKLVSFDVDEGKGKEQPRFGPDPVGYLIYSHNGRMAAVLAGTQRAPLKPPQAIGAQPSGDCDKSVADFLAYAGRYEARGDRVLHHVEVSVFTNLVGTTLERRFALQGDTLTIRTVPPEIWGSSNVLVWKRA